MKLSRFLAAVTILNVTALIYVHQHVSLVKTGYEIRDRESSYRELMERHHKLNGEVLKLKSPRKVVSRLAGSNVEMKVAGDIRVICLADSAGSAGKDRFQRDGLITQKRGVNRFFAWIGLNTRAEAKTE